MRLARYRNNEHAGQFFERPRQEELSSLTMNSLDGSGTIGSAPQMTLASSPGVVFDHQAPEIAVFMKLAGELPDGVRLGQYT